MSKGSVSVRELQQNLRLVMARVERGETVEVTRRRRPVARLTPTMGRELMTREECSSVQDQFRATISRISG